MDKERTVQEFYDWCEERGVTLTPLQKLAAADIFQGLIVIGLGRGSGKSFLLHLMEEFVNG